MKGLKKIISLSIVSILLASYLSFIPNISYAENTKDKVIHLNDVDFKMEYSDAFLEYLKKPEEERSGFMPSPNKILPTTKEKALNPFYRVAELGALQQKFSLKDVIPENVKIRNQKQTNTCWAFAGLGTVEGTLAYRNYKNNDEKKVYDFSERHLAYSEMESYSDIAHNIYANNMKVEQGGNYYNWVNYLSLGNGAVNEEAMPFVNSSKPINSSETQNKKTQTTLYDTKLFTSYDKNITDSQRSEMINEMKTFMNAYGPIYAGCRADNSGSDHINLEKGTINYTGDEYADHAVTIIGWDDNYPKENFNNVPKGNGAWIVKNSWGESTDMTYAEAVTSTKLSIIKDPSTGIVHDYVEDFSDEELYNFFLGLNPELSDLTLKQLIIMMLTSGEDPMTYDETTDSFKGSSIGDHGLMYISYYDNTIYSTIVGIEKITDTVDFNNVYTHAETALDYFFGASTAAVGNTYYMAEKFLKGDSKDEYIKQVGFITTIPCSVKVYVNKNNSALTDTGLQEVALKNGESGILSPGFHVLELQNEVKIEGDQFAVALRVETPSDQLRISCEAIPNQENDPAAYELCKNSDIQKNVSFVGIGDNMSEFEWEDLASSMDILKGNTTLKVYTTNNEPVTLSSIRVSKAPNKTTYTEGENFDKTGMEVEATYSDGTKDIISDYTISNGNNLTKDRTYITIEYQGKTTTQEITVNEGQGPNPSVSPSPSPSSSPSVSPSVSPSSSPSVSPSVSPSPSPSVSPSTSPSPSTSVRPSVSPSPSTSVRPSTSPSPSTSVSPSTSPSPSTSVRPSTSTSPSTSVRPSTSPSPSTSVRPSTSTSPSPSTSPEPSNPPEEHQPVPCDFTYATVRTTDIDTANKGSVSVTVENIEISPLNDTYEYYYYLSTNPDEQNIKKWVKINDSSKDGKSISFTIKSSDVENYAELLKNQNVYLYIEEITTRDGNQKVAQSNGLKLKAEIQKDPIEVERPNNNGNNNDPTTAKEPIPYTGVIKFTMVFALAAGGTIFLYRKYKKLDNDIKGK